MSWKASLSKHLPLLRFHGCTSSPSSRGIIKFYENNYDELRQLNPCMQLLLRTTFNANPAITTDLDFTKSDLLRYMLQTGKFRNVDGSLAHDRAAAAEAWLGIDWDAMTVERWKSPGFDPERPFLDEDFPEWKKDEKIQADLAVYLDMKSEVDHLEKTFKAGPDKEYERANNELLMCQRVDLWCAGEDEVEMAVRHLAKLGERFNKLEHETDDFITDFHTGVADFS